MVPLVVYGAWFAWATRFDQGQLKLANVELVPSYVGDGLAACVRALTGLSYFDASGWRSA